MPKLDAQIGLLFAAMGGAIVMCFVVALYYLFVDLVPANVVPCMLILFVLTFELGACVGVISD